MTNDWLRAAEAACQDALEDPPRADLLLRIAQVHALIAIGQETAGIRELIVLTEDVDDTPAPDDDENEIVREEC